MRLRTKLTALAAGTSLLPLAAAAQASIPRPLGNITLEQAVGNIIKGVLALVGSLALVFIIWGGWQWMTAQGAPDSVTKAKGTIIWAVLGLIVCFTAYAMVDFILSVL